MPEFADKAFMESYSEYIKNNFVSSGGGANFDLCRQLYGIAADRFGRYLRTRA